MKNIRWQILMAALLAIGIAAPASGAKRFTITSFGAVGDGKTLNTQAIQSLIDKMAKEGGGTVVVPEGTFITGALFFKQGVNLYIEKNGTLKGSVEQNDYPQVKTRWEGIERVWTSALLNFTDMNGVDFGGDGTVDGSGDVWLQRSGFLRGRGRGAPGGRGEGQPPQPQPQSAAGRGAPPQGPRYGRPRLVCFQNCKRVRISRVRLKQEAVWCLHILYSEDVIVDGIQIRCDHNIPSADGIDIDSSRKVRVRNVDIDNNDDSITIKSGKDEDGLRVNRPSEDIIVENSHFHNGGSLVAMGSETSGGIRNVMVRHCVADSDNSAPIRFKTQPSRGGVVENITFSDIVLNGTRQAFELNMEWRMVPPIAPPAKVLPIIRNVTLRNIRGTVKTVGIMHGLVDSPIRNVKFEKCDITADKGFVIENVRNVDLSGLKLAVKNGEAITKKNVE
jgi:polygalacturonase